MRTRLTITLVCLVTVVMTSCLGETHIKAKQQSPTGKYEAELAESDTGAVGGWMSDVAVTQLNPSRWTRLLGREKETVFGIDLRSDHITFIWKSNDELEITCRGCDSSKIDLKKSAWQSVSISYKIY
jgi:hypothetical protein